MISMDKKRIFWGLLIISLGMLSSYGLGIYLENSADGFNYAVYFAITLITSFFVSKRAGTAIGTIWRSVLISYGIGFVLFVASIVLLSGPEAGSGFVFEVITWSPLAIFLIGIPLLPTTVLISYFVHLLVNYPQENKKIKK